MSIKKIFAGIAAAALTVSSVSVAAFAEADAAPMPNVILSVGKYDGGTYDSSNLPMIQIGNPSWGNPIACKGYKGVVVEYTCENMDEVDKLYLAAQANSQKGTWYPPEQYQGIDFLPVKPKGWYAQLHTVRATSGTITLDFTNDDNQERGFENLLLQIQAKKTVKDGDEFDPKVTITSAKLVAINWNGEEVTQDDITKPVDPSNPSEPTNPGDTTNKTDVELKTGKIEGGVLKHNEWDSNPNAIANPQFIFKENWDKPEALAGYDSLVIEYTCGNTKDVGGFSLVAQSVDQATWDKSFKNLTFGPLPNGWYNTTVDGAKASGTITLDLSKVQDCGYQVLLVQVIPAEGFKIGDNFDPQVEITSAKLVAKKSADESKPDDSQPEESKPDDSQPEESKPNDSQPEESKPEESKPDDSQPEESKSEETTGAAGNVNGDNTDDKNQPTGLIIAVVPAAVAAAGVVISKKRR